ncbi:BDNF/NT-3 growth factors receptor-like [Uloborus diversus]|uniref:BDNF/NT-3 growth factors receptor-like n=1 Tax=Uloborus diversus TaxID=327109 RepID=UPI00240A32D2|nr:BDNF/NT-3 growth factors receptor-like [Uloborus diversus]
MELLLTTSVENVTDAQLHIAPTEGAFGPHQLLGMLSNSKNIPNSDSDTNATVSNGTTIITFPSNSNPHTSSVVALCLIPFLLVISAISVVWCYRKYKGYSPWWLPGARARNSAAMSLSKVMQQYISNPNYYSNSPDGPLLRMFREFEIPEENIAVEEVIGEGYFGKVLKGIYTTTSGVTLPVAVKTLKENANPEGQIDFEREVEIMSSFSHENILKLLGIVKKENEATPWMIFEFMRFGDLAEVLRSNSPLMPDRNTEPELILQESDLVRISEQIANGMLYLASQHFVHRDLATRNCLVGEGCVIKISDFGMSRDIYTSDYYKISGSRMLPIRWMAPESISYGKFSLDSDTWAYGVVLWEVFTYGKQPYFGHTNDEVLRLVLQGILLSPPENAPEFICDIMKGCWKTDPRDRLVFSEICDIISANTTSSPYAEVVPTPPSSDIEINMDSDNYLIPTVSVET